MFWARSTVVQLGVHLRLSAPDLCVGSRRGAQRHGGAKTNNINDAQCTACQSVERRMILMVEHVVYRRSILPPQAQPIEIRTATGEWWLMLEWDFSIVADVAGSN